MPRTYSKQSAEYRASRRKYFTTAHSANTQLRCAMEGCDSHRHGISTMCKAHMVRNNLHGHPLGCRIRRSEYQTERDLISTFVLRHREHPAITAAVELADSWLQAADRSVEVPARKEAARLFAQGIRGDELVTEILSMWLYIWWNAKHVAWLDSAEVQARQIGTAVLYLAPRTNLGETPSGRPKYREIPGRVRAAAGKYFVRQLAPLAANVFRTIEQEREALKEKREQLARPFECQALIRD